MCEALMKSQDSGSLRPSGGVRWVSSLLVQPASKSGFALSAVQFFSSQTVVVVYTRQVFLVQYVLRVQPLRMRWSK
jgi:hypothetical protein